jgi:hypothetical protein
MTGTCGTARLTAADRSTMPAGRAAAFGVTPGGAQMSQKGRPFLSSHTLRLTSSSTLLKPPYRQLPLTGGDVRLILDVRRYSNAKSKVNK